MKMKMRSGDKVIKTPTLCKYSCNQLYWGLENFTIHLDEESAKETELNDVIDQLSGSYCATSGIFFFTVITTVLLPIVILLFWNNVYVSRVLLVINVVCGVFLSFFTLKKWCEDWALTKFREALKILTPSQEVDYQVSNEVLF